MTHGQQQKRRSCFVRSFDFMDALRDRRYFGDYLVAIVRGVVRYKGNNGVTI